MNAPPAILAAGTRDPVERQPRPHGRLMPELKNAKYEKYVAPQTYKPVTTQ